MECRLGRGGVAIKLALAQVQLEVCAPQGSFQKADAVRKLLLGSADKAVVQVPHLLNLGEGCAEGGGDRGETGTEQERGQRFALLPSRAAGHLVLSAEQRGLSR